MTKSYKLEIDLLSGQAQYTTEHGYSRSISFGYDKLSANQKLLNVLTGSDAYLLATLQAAKNLDCLKVVVKERNYKYFTLLSLLFCTVMMVSNVLSTKLVNVGGFTIAGAMIIYPISYIFDYVLTDVYGYQNTRRAILGTALCLALFNLSLMVLIILPPSIHWHYQVQLEVIFSRMLRTFAASTAVFCVAFFVSSYILQKVKIRTAGKSLFKRIFYSFVLSETLESFLFCILAFGGVWPIKQMVRYMVISFFIKFTYELIVYGIFTKPIINFIKKSEQLDTLDSGTNFTPFSWEVNYPASTNIFKLTEKS